MSISCVDFKRHSVVELQPVITYWELSLSVNSLKTAEEVLCMQLFIPFSGHETSIKQRQEQLSSRNSHHFIEGFHSHLEAAGFVMELNKYSSLYQAESNGTKQYQPTWGQRSAK